MSVSTQPTAWQGSLQRALSSRLSANIVSDICSTRNAAENTNRKSFATVELVSSQRQVEDIPHWPAFHPQDAVSHPCHPHETASQPAQPQDPSCQTHLPIHTCLTAHGVQPAVISKVHPHRQARQHTSRDTQLARVTTIQPPASSIQVGHLLVKPAGTHAQPSMQSEKRPCLPTQGNLGCSLIQHAQQMEAEFAAVRAGTGVIADKATWIAAARQTAHELQDAARVKVLKAFQSALGYMDEDTLLAKVADHLQLQSSPQQRPPAAEQPASDLQAPHMFSCPRKARSRRCRRPASAAAHGMAREPSQGNTGVPSLNRPLSAPAERSGWDWGDSLPATTSALLQAVEAAAAAEPRPATSSLLQAGDVALTGSPLPGSAILAVSPPSWRDSATATQQIASAASGLSQQDGNARRHPPSTAIPAGAAAEHMNAEAYDAGHASSLAAQLLTEAVGTQPAEQAAHAGRTDAARPVLQPVVRTASLQASHMATALHEVASVPADKPRSPADCTKQCYFGMVAEDPVSPLRSARLPADQSGHLPVDGIPLPSRAEILHEQASCQHQLMPATGSLPSNSMPLLQSPFAAMAGVPLQPTQTPLLSQMGPPAVPPHGFPAASHSAGTLSIPCHGGCTTVPAGSHLKQMNSPFGQSDRVAMHHASNQAQMQGSAEGASDGLKGQGMAVRLPLSPSLRSNGLMTRLQPAAKAQRALPHSAHSALATDAASSGRKRSYAQMQDRSLHENAELRFSGLHAVCQTELLPGRNVVVAAAYIHDLAHLQVLPSKWCWVARIDKVMAAHMKVSWYGKHNGRWTLARHGAGPDEGQVRTGDVSLSDHQVLAVFDRFTGNKDVSSDVLRIATARLCSIVGQDTVVDQENITLHDYA